jgi:hypothetical protein
LGKWMQQFLKGRIPRVEWIACKKACKCNNNLNRKAA